MIYAIIGGFIGFVLGALILFLWMRAKSRTDAARITELTSALCRLSISMDKSSISRTFYARIMLRTWSKSI